MSFTQAANTTPFDLERCTEFPKALIYGFNPERVDRYPNEGDANFLIDGMDQVQDMLNAYLYAQDVVLPKIREVGIAQITSAMVLEWTQEIHRRIAKTLAEDYQSVPGEYVKQEVLRWHHGARTRSYYLDYLCMPSLTEEKICTPDVTEEKIETLANNFGINVATLKHFLKILVRVRDDDKVAVPESQKPFINWQDKKIKGIVTLYKLTVLYRENKFTAAEKKTIDEIVKISTDPALIPQKMAEFAEELVQRWRDCDATDITQVAKLAHFTFSRLTDIHGYFNANGRMATCWMNIILRSLGQRGILMRNPGEAEEAKSSYAVAIQHFDDNPQLLMDHVKGRLLEEKPFADLVLVRDIVNKMELCDIMKKSRNEFPGFPLQKMYKKLSEEAGRPFSLMVDLVVHNSKKSLLKKEWGKLVNKGLIPSEFKDCDPSKLQLTIRYIVTKKMLDSFKQTRREWQRKKIELTLKAAAAGKSAYIATNTFQPAPQAQADNVPKDEGKNSNELSGGRPS